MKGKTALAEEERKALLSDLATLKSDDDDAVEQDPKWFLPLDAHRRALRLETLVVRGGRGAGKSALFHFLGHLQKAPELARHLEPGLPHETVWCEAFGLSREHPSSLTLGSFAGSLPDEQRRMFWFGWLCARLSGVVSVPLPSGELARALQTDVHHPERIAAASSQELVQLSAWLDAVERGLSAPVILTYDGLDRVGVTLAEGRQLTASLLGLWLSLADRYRRIRPKIFVRQDLFDASTAAFPDASKLDARSVSLEWRVEDLYRVLIKHMANVSDPLKQWIEGSSRGVPLGHEGLLGWMPPALPEEGKVSQKGFVGHLVGDLMGSGTNKGMSYRWIPNRLQDAHARVVPRSILALVRNAATFALDRGPTASRLRLLAPGELQGALQKTSQRRVAELKEEFPVVSRLQALGGKTVMLERQVAVRALSAPSQGDDGYTQDGEEVLRTLIDLGVLQARTDGRIDVPDIYRYGFGILRKGGVRRPR